VSNIPEDQAAVLISECHGSTQLQTAALFMGNEAPGIRDCSAHWVWFCDVGHA
jgi:hypothetical protein